MLLRPVLLLIFLAAPAFAAPATTKTSDMEPLCDGTVRYIPAPGWTLIEKSPNDLVARYKLEDPPAVMTIDVQPQDRAIAESSKDAMAKIINKGIRESAAREGREVVETPRQVEDPRFFLKMHDAIKVEGKIADRIQLYRVIGLNLVHVSCSATVDAIEQSQPALEAAENLMAGMKVARGSKRVLYPKAQLRAIVPLDWNERRFDQPNGQVAIYTDPKDATRQIILTARILPKAARDDKTKLATFVETMIDQERVLPSPLKQMQAEEVKVPDDKYVRQTQLKLTGASEPMRVDTRYQVVGDVLAGVRSIGKEADADAMKTIAERFAASLKPIKDPP